MEREFPAAYYGRLSSQEGRVDQYDFLGRSEGFPDEAWTSFKSLNRAVQWKSGPDATPYDPCFAAWPVDGQSMIVARLSDAGNDGKNRPHTMHMQGVWVNRTSEPNWRFLIGCLLDESAWPASTPRSGNHPIRLVIDNQPDTEIAKKVAELLKDVVRPPAILVANHNQIQHQGFPTVLGIAKHSFPAQNEGFNTGSQQFTDTSSSDQKAVARHVVEDPKWSRWRLAIIGLLAFVTIGATYFVLQKLSRQEMWCKELENKNYDLNDQLSKREWLIRNLEYENKKLKKLVEAKSVLENERDELKKQTTHLKTENETLKKDLDATKESLAKLQDHPLVKLLLHSGVSKAPPSPPDQESSTEK